MPIRCVKLSEIREELQGHLNRRELFPIIGSGFTKGCETKYGKQFLVPSGEDMKKYMITYLREQGEEVPEYIPFSKVAGYYEKKASKHDICEYFKHHFLGVKLQDNRKAFLNIDWRLIYTLNLDDAIEKNSFYDMVLLPNRNFELDAISDQKCVFKLHGDAESFVKYGVNDSPTLSITKYIHSIYTNQRMLTKLKTDLYYSNTLFVGCSLNDELDLLAITQSPEEKNISDNRNRYFVTDTEPTELQKLDLEDFLIDTVILVDNYNEFYTEFVALTHQCQDFTQESLGEFYNLHCCNAPQKKNYGYLLHGKFLLNRKKKVIYFPDFFVERNIQEDILRDMENSQIQIIHGSRISGKSYLLAGILRNIHNRDTYYFDSRENIDISLLQELLEKERSILFLDTNVLSADAFCFLLKYDFYQLKKRKLNVICCVNNSDRNILEMVGYTTQHLEEKDVLVKVYPLKNRFTYGRELDFLNNRLKLAGNLPFSGKQTILDNLLNIQKKLSIDLSNQFDGPIVVKENEVEKFCLLILLALNEKVTAEKLVQCGLSYKSKELLQELKVTIEEDHRNLLTLSPIDSVSYQIVCNANVWLLNQIRELSRDLNLEHTIVQAFIKLVKDFLGGTTQYKKVESLVKFDKLNEIFPGGKRLILKIYDGLRPVLLESYQYFHQYAKCHLWGMSKSDYDLDELDKAKTAAHTALIMVEEDLLPEKVALHASYAHILNTLTIIYAKLCLIEKFENPNTVDAAVGYFSKAIDCRENYHAMCSAKSRTAKEEDGGILNCWISHVLSQKSVIPSIAYHEFSELLKKWQNLRQQYN